MIKSLTTTEFAAAYHMSYFVWISSESRFYQYILQYNSDPLVFIIAYKRYHDGSAWSDFTADGSNTYTLSSGEHGVMACWKDARYYTGAQKPTSYREDYIFSHDQWVYDSTENKVFMQEETGMLQPSADLDLVCAEYCTEKDTHSGQCWESVKCPKQEWWVVASCSAVMHLLNVQANLSYSVMSGLDSLLAVTLSTPTVPTQPTNTSGRSPT